jgi:RNA polymerase sigma factor, sigma-70 family
MDDSKIINLFFERSEQAIIELSNKYGGVCKKVSLNILNNLLDTEECVNEAYLGAWNSIPPQKPSPLLTYVCRIVRNISIKRYRANTAIKRNSHYDIALDELYDCIPSPCSVDTECETKELVKIIDDFLDALDTDSRVMFMHRYWFSDSLADIARLFGITEHNAAVRLSRIRQRMRKYLFMKGVSL